ncbi:hypothetical protein [Rhodococcus gannanensis]|uniref:Uncharacterized protein n=1 Tax=Rhodococcus gannanensis TaxID=1960308 RepID=A0ABW4P692_9NOCA
MSVGVLAGLAIWGFAFLVSTPETVCYDHMPFPPPPAPGYYGVDYETTRAPLPIPAARCTTELEGTDVAATAWVVDWTGTALAGLGIVLMAVTLWTLRLDARERSTAGSPDRPGDEH